jgi:hypothetical protein
LNERHGSILAAAWGASPETKDSEAAAQGHELAAVRRFGLTEDQPYMSDEADDWIQERMLDEAFDLWQARRCLITSPLCVFVGDYRFASAHSITAPSESRARARASELSVSSTSCVDMCGLQERRLRKALR